MRRALVLLALALLPSVQAADPHPCRDGLLERLERGATLVCSGILVQPETLFAYQQAVDARPTLEKQVKALEEQVLNLRAQLAEERANARAQLEVCETFRGQCEASRVPPKCSAPPLLERPAFVWPVALVGGFVGGVAFDRWGVGCR